MGTSAETASGAEARPDEPPLVFVHIQKTAGYSLRKILLREYGGRHNVTHLPNVFSKGERSHEEVAAIAAAPPPGKRVFHGHIMCWPDVAWPPDTRFFTILRDPVDRAISHYYWLRERSDKFSRTMDLDEAVQNGWVPDNLQTRVLAARSEPFGRVPEAALEQAIEAIDRFSVVGLTHRFDESLVLLSRTFGWRRVTYERVNVTPGRTRREDLTEETVALIRQFNALDEKLFAHASERFERDVAEQGRGFEIEVAALKAANARYAQVADGTGLDAELPTITNGLPPGRVDAEQLLVETQAELLAREEVRLAESEGRKRLERQHETSTRRNDRLRRKLAAKEKRNQRLVDDAAKREAELQALRRQLGVENPEPAPKRERTTRPKKAASGRAARGAGPKKGAAVRAARGAPKKATGERTARGAAPTKIAAVRAAREAAPTKGAAGKAARGAAPKKTAAGKAAARGAAPRKAAPKKLTREAPRETPKSAQRRAS